MIALAHEKSDQRTGRFGGVNCSRFQLLTIVRRIAADKILNGILLGVSAEHLGKTFERRLLCLSARLEGDNSVAVALLLNSILSRDHFEMPKNELLRT